MQEIAFGIGLILLVLAFLAFRKTRNFIARCGTAQGTIAGFTEEQDSDNGLIYYYSVIRFVDSSGASHEIRGPQGLQEPPEIGTPVSITYDPGQPLNAWTSGTAAPWVIPWLTLIAGLCAIAGGVAVRLSGG